MLAGCFGETVVRVVVQINPIHAEESYLYLNQLAQDMKTDSELVALPEHCVLNTMQTLFVVSGYDYTSFFYGLGKKKFFQTS